MKLCVPPTGVLPGAGLGGVLRARVVRAAGGPRPRRARRPAAAGARAHVHGGRRRAPAARARGTAAGRPRAAASGQTCQVSTVADLINYLAQKESLATSTD